MSTILELDDMPQIAARTVQVHRGGLELIFPYDAVLVAAVKALGLFRYDGGRKTWQAAATAPNLRAIADFAKVQDFRVSDEVKALAEAVVEARATNLEQSAAAAADFDVAGLGVELRPYQRAGVAYMAKNVRGVINADEPGMGKTGQALATLAHIGAWPAVVVCPASVKEQWAREAAQWVPGCRAEIVWDGTGAARDAGCGTRDAGGRRLIVVNYDLLGAQMENLRAHKPEAVIFDEMHWLKNSKTKRYEAGKALVRGVKVRLGLTGTPIENRPVEILSLLSLLGRVDDIGGELPEGLPKEQRTGWWRFAFTYCGAKQKRVKKGGKLFWDLSGATNLPRLRAELRRTCMVRRRKEEVLAELPPKQRVVVPVELSNRDEYLRAQADIVAWARREAERGEGRRGDAETDEEVMRRVMEAARLSAERAEKAPALVRMSALRAIAARGKLAAVREWMDDFAESGAGLVAFGIHLDIVGEVAGWYKVPAVVGGMALRERQAAVDAFKAGRRWLFVGNMQACGTGVDGLQAAASDVAFLEQPFKPSIVEQAEDRLHRMGQRNAVTAWHFIAKDTVDVWLWELNEAKRAVAVAALDAEVSDGGHK